MTDKYVYLYRITLSKDGEDPLYYFGIRWAFKGLPEQDEYMGSPVTYAYLWEDNSYHKKKDIIRCEEYSESNINKLALMEKKLIDSAWDKYGVYGNGGRCLNMNSGLMYAQTEETRRKKSEYMKQIASTPEYKEKMSNIFKELWKTEEYRSKMEEKFRSEEHRKKISHRNKQRWIDDPSLCKKQSDTVKERFKDSKERERMSLLAKERWKNNPELREKIISKNRETSKKRGESIRKAYQNDPSYREKVSQEKKRNNPMHNKSSRDKMSATKRRKFAEKQQIKNSLENHFD